MIILILTISFALTASGHETDNECFLPNQLSRGDLTIVKTVEYESSVLLKCGTPPWEAELCDRVHVTWFKDDVMITGTGNNSHELRALEEGVYRCQVGNSTAEKTLFCELFMLGNLYLCL